MLGVEMQPHGEMGVSRLFQHVGTFISPRTHGLLGASQRGMEEKFRNASVQALKEKNRKERESSSRVWS